MAQGASKNSSTPCVEPCDDAKGPYCPMGVRRLGLEIVALPGLPGDRTLLFTSRQIADIWLTAWVNEEGGFYG